MVGGGQPSSSQKIRVARLAATYRLLRGLIGRNDSGLSGGRAGRHAGDGDAALQGLAGLSQAVTLFSHHGGSRAREAQSTALSLGLSWVWHASAQRRARLALCSALGFHVGAAGFAMMWVVRGS